MHLRIEKDAGAWAQILGGRHIVEARYRAAMREAGFSGNTVLYIASALLTYKGGPAELKQVQLPAVTDTHTPRKQSGSRRLAGLSCSWSQQSSRCLCVEVNE